MQIVSGIATLAYHVICCWVGVRLVLRAKQTQERAGTEVRLPEFWFGLFFLFYGVVASVMNIIVYASWADPNFAIPELLSRVLHGGFFWTSSVGVYCLCLFVQRTFRAADDWAKWMVWGGTGAAVFGSLLCAFTEGYELRVINGAGYWIHYIVRDLAFAWVGVESVNHWWMARRRARLGLADPLVTNRFLLIGLWGWTIALVTHADGVARIWYYLQTGSTEWVPEIGAPIMYFGMSAATTCLTLATTMIWLTFFPSESYRNWIADRSERTLRR